MALASSSSSALRTGAARLSAKPIRSQGKLKLPRVVKPETRAYSAAAALAHDPHTSTSYDPSPSRRSNSFPSPPSSYSASGSTVTGSSAQAYLSDLLSLPSERQFSPSLSLQMLTHKSYRYAHMVRNSSSNSTEIDEGIASHNGRLAFLGRRAFASYLSIFIHDALGGAGQSSQLQELGSDFLRGRNLQDRMDALRHVNNLGRAVGKPWAIGEMVRFDRNQTTPDGTGSLRVNGLAVEAILGGIFTQFGSPAAHRAFHLHMLPHFTTQLRDPRLVDRVESIKDGLEKEFGSGILLP